MENRAEVAHLILLAKHREVAAGAMEVYVGDAREDKLGRVESAGIQYRLAARVEGPKMPSAIHPTQIDLLGIGQYVRFVFTGKLTEQKSEKDQ